MIAATEPLGGAATPKTFGGFPGVTRRFARRINRFIAGITQTFPSSFPVGNARALSCAWK
jgi:hypothetical protein